MASDSTDQKQGVVNKCPACGGALKAFVSVCELCGHELAEVDANKTVQAIVRRFGEIEAEAERSGLRGKDLEKEIVARKARAIRDFPIPNSREDIQSLIHYIQPKVQDSLKPDPNAEDWRVRLQEVINLAKNAYKGDAKARAQIEEVERSLSTTFAGTLQNKAKRSPMVALAVVGVIVLAAGGIASVQWDKWKQKQCEEKDLELSAGENARLEGIVKQVESLHREKKFADALASLTKVKWEYEAACRKADADQARARWESRRAELAALMQQGEAKASADAKAADDARKAAEDKAEAEKRAEAERQAVAKIVGEGKKEAAARKAANAKEW